MRFRLAEAHYFPGDRYLEGDKERESRGPELGTVVGDGTPFPVTTPTLSMIPLDSEAEEAIEAERERVARNGALDRYGRVDPADNLPVRGQDTYDARYLPGSPGVKRPTVKA